jgi:iron complex transport system substrate-binding protein
MTRALRSNIRFRELAALVAFVAVVVVAGFAQAREIKDMAGRSVALPDYPMRVVTIGAVPVLNSFLFALGEQDKIVNGLPPELARKFQYVFAPNLAGEPIVQGAEKGLSVETIVNLKPDVILTMDPATVQALAAFNLPVVFLRWTAPNDVIALMALLGDIFRKPSAARDYAAYFDQATRRVASIVAQADAAHRPRVLYANLRRLTQPHRIADWWIARAGGQSLTDNERTEESYTFSLEQFLAWDPQILIVADRAERDMALREPRFRNVSAVRDNRVYVAPAGAHLWANRTIEQPLTLIWATSIIHPQELPSDVLRADTADFYERFFHVKLTAEQIDEILAGAPGR